MENSVANVDHARFEELDLLALVRALWKCKWIIFGSTVLATVIAVLVAWILPNTYRSEALLVAVERNQSNDFAALSPQLGGIAGLAGFRMAAETTDDLTLAIATLQSRRFVIDFVRRRDILVPLLASRRWIAESGTLVLDDDLFDPESGQWVRDAEPPKTVIPSDLEAYDKFVEILQVLRDEDTGLVRLSIDHHSPVIARQWLLWLIEDINQNIKATDVSLATESIAFLEEQVKMTSLAEMQNMLFGLIEEQMRTVVVANVLPEYALRTVDPPVVSERPFKPNRFFICALGAFLGLVLSGTATIVRAGMLPPDTR